MTALALLQATQTASERLEAARQGLDTPLAERLVGLLGIATMIGLAVLLSYDRRRINWRLVGIGLALQFVFGLIVLKTGPGREFFDFVGGAVTGLLGFQEQAREQLTRQHLCFRLDRQGVARSPRRARCRRDGAPARPPVECRGRRWRTPSRRQ